MSIRYSADGSLVIVDTAQGAMFVPTARWPEEAKLRGLGSYATGTFVAAIPAAADAEFKPLPRKRLLFGLIALGKSESDVGAAIAAIPDASQRELMRIEFENTTAFHRYHPLMVTMLALLNVEPAAADVAWLSQQEGL